MDLINEPPPEYETRIPYMVFAAPYFYPNGGWEDFQCFFDSLEEAKEYVINLPIDDFQKAHIVKNGDEIICKYICDMFPEKPWTLEE